MEKAHKRKRDSVSVNKEEIKRVIEETGGDITLQEIGDMYGITRMRVCQIEKTSLKKLSEIETLKHLL